MIDSWLAFAEIEPHEFAPQGAASRSHGRRDRLIDAAEAARRMARRFG